MNIKSIVATMPGKAISTICACVWIVGCTPKMDWRDVRQENAGWKATFPGKPVEVSRKIVLGEANAAVTLNLKSARIDDVMYAVGWIDNTKPAAAQKLQEAMLANIQAAPDSIRRTSIKLFGQTAQEIEAHGLMRIDPAAPPVKARLWMRTLEVVPADTSATAAEKTGTPAPSVATAARIIEIIVVGPASQINSDDARLFLDSFSLL